MATTFKFGTDGNWAVKEDLALAYNDENGNFKPLPFDFTRASTATRVNKDGLIETVPSGKPRIDFLNNTSGHLLLEPSRKNNVTYSNDISTYSNFGSTDDVNVAISPDGSQNASSFEGNGAYDQVFLSSPSMTLASAGSYTISVFAKKGTNNFMQLFANGFTGASNTEAYFDLENGTTPTSGANIEDYGSGWYRCSTTVTIDAGDLIGTLSVRVTPSTSDFRWSPFSDNVGKSVFVYGFQMETGNYATSYIPTEGSTVTRVAETANGAGNSTVFNGSEGVLYAEIEALGVDSSYRQITIGNSTDNIKILFNNSSTRLRGLLKVGGINYADLYDETQTEIKYLKIALKYKSGDFALWVNGVEKDTATSGSIPTGMAEIAFDDGGGASDFYGKCKDLRVYNTALSDSELQALTS